ncbi:MAG: hypothetical protein WCO51_10130 [bacterium]
MKRCKDKVNGLKKGFAWRLKQQLLIAKTTYVDYSESAQADFASNSRDFSRQAPSGIIYGLVLLLLVFTLPLFGQQPKQPPTTDDPLDRAAKKAVESVKGIMPGELQPGSSEYMFTSVLDDTGGAQKNSLAPLYIASFVFGVKANMGEYQWNDSRWSIKVNKQVPKLELNTSNITSVRIQWAEPTPNDENRTIVFSVEARGLMYPHTIPNITSRVMNVADAMHYAFRTEYAKGKQPIAPPWTLIVGGMAAVAAAAAAINNLRNKQKPSSKNQSDQPKNYILQLNRDQVELNTGQTAQVTATAWRVDASGNPIPAPEAMIRVEAPIGLIVNPIAGQGSLQMQISSEQTLQPGKKVLNITAEAAGAITSGTVTVEIQGGYEMKFLEGE